MSDSRLIHWLRECYLADRAWHGVSSLRSGSIEHHHVMRGSETMATGLVHEEVVPPSYAEEVAARAQLYAREKELLYGCVAMCGRFNGSPTMTPLVVYPAAFDVERPGVVSILAQRWRLNPKALEMLGIERDGGDALAASLGDGYVSERFRDCLMKLAVANGVAAESLGDWPRLASAAELNRAAKSDGLSLLPSAHLFLTSRSVHTRGVLDELGKLANLPVENWSDPLRCLLGGEGKSIVEEETGERAYFVPEMLSHAQSRVLEAARRHAVSVCHGPPGTGKSFTIAAIAMDHVARGESVLIVSQQDAAVDVVQRMVDEMAGGEYLTVRGGRGSRRKEMSDFLERSLAAGSWRKPVERLADKSRVRALQSTIKGMEDAEEMMTSAMDDAVKHGGWVSMPSPGWWQKLRMSWALRNFEQRPLLAGMLRELEDLQKMRIHHTSGLMEMQLENARHNVVSRREGFESLKMFLSALRARKGSEQAERFAKTSHRMIRRVFPVWLVALDDLHGVVPFDREVFDLVVIDEASQCDLAQILPALQRAKRVVVVGDRKQLRHVSFLSETKQFELAERVDLSKELVDRFNYRNRSLMDVAVDNIRDGSATALLNEHFRSRAEIVGFSNQRFYGGAMHVMNDRPWESEREGLTLVRCNGERSDEGVNEVEIAKVLEILASYADADWSEGEVPTIGVVSPFRNQVDAIRERLAKVMDPQQMGRLLREHRLRVDTAHGFQGDERDVMVVTLVVDENSPHGARRFLEREDVFNVMITRARHKQWVVSSLDGGSAPGSLLGEYLMYCARSNGMERREVSFTDRFVSEVESVLKGQGCETWAFEVVAGVEVDLIVRFEGKVVGIDLIGYPGASRDYLPLEHARLLSRCGISLIPVGYVEWLKRRDDCLSFIGEMLGLPDGG